MGTGVIKKIVGILTGSEALAVMEALMGRLNFS